MDANSVDLLDMDIVEGEHPCSIYYAAELRTDIDTANRAVEDAKLRVRLVKRWRDAYRSRRLTFESADEEVATIRCPTWQKSRKLDL